MPADLRCVFPPLFAGAVVHEASRAFDPKLPGEKRNDPRGSFREVLQEDPQKSRCAQLDGEAEPVVVSAVNRNDVPVSIIEIKVTRQLIRRRRSNETAVVPSLLVTKEANRHTIPPPISISGGIVCEAGREWRFP